MESSRWHLPRVYIQVVVYIFGRCWQTMVLWQSFVAPCSAGCRVDFWVRQALDQVRTPYWKMGRRKDVKNKILMFKLSKLFHHNRRDRTALAFRNFEITSLKCYMNVTLGLVASISTNGPAAKTEIQLLNHPNIFENWMLAFSQRMFKELTTLQLLPTKLPTYYQPNILQAKDTANNLNISIINKLKTVSSLSLSYCYTMSSRH